jgi:hypothetical protein
MINIIILIKKIHLTVLQTNTFHQIKLKKKRKLQTLKLYKIENNTSF